MGFDTLEPDSHHHRKDTRKENVKRVFESLGKSSEPVTVKDISFDLTKRGTPIANGTIRSILNELLEREEIIICKRAIQNSKKPVSFYDINPVEKYKLNMEQQMLHENTVEIIQNFEKRIENKCSGTITELFILAMDEIMENYRKATASLAKRKKVRFYERKAIFEEKTEHLSNIDRALTKGSHPQNHAFIRMFRDEPITELTVCYRSVMKYEIGNLKVAKRHNS